MIASIDLGPMLEDFVSEAVRAGRYPSRQAVIREAVRLLRDHEAGWLEFERDILSRIDAAPLATGEAASDRLRRRYSETADRRAL